MKPIKAAIISLAGTTLSDEEKFLLEHENPVGVSLFDRNIQSPAQLTALTKEIKKVVGRNDILLSIDQEGGRVCRLKPPFFRSYLAQAAIGSMEQNEAKEAARLHADLISYDLHSVGINCNFAPTLDVTFSSMTKALKSRCFSPHPETTAELGQIIFSTYNQNAILPCIKHIPGHGSAHHDPHLQLSVIKRVYQRSLYPFKQLAPSALMAMTAHVVFSQYDNLPLTMSAKTIQQLVRNRLEFNGLLVSDALEMKALPGTLPEKTIAARQAGCDIVCYCHGDYHGVKTVLDNCGCLSDLAMDTWKKISSLISQPYHAIDIKLKAQRYEYLSSLAPVITDDYDAVEVLNQL